MGTTFQHRGRGTTDREFFQDLMGSRYTILDCATVNGRSEGGAFYAATRTNEGPEQGQVWAFVALVHWVFGYHNFGYKDMEETMGPNAAECPARILDLLSPLGECTHDGTWCTHCGAQVWAFGGQLVSVAKPGQRAEVGGPNCYGVYRKPSGWSAGTPTTQPHEPGGHPFCGTCSAREWRADCRKTADARARAAKVRPGQVLKFARSITFDSGTELDTLTFEARDIFRANGLRYRVTGWRTMTGWELVTS